MCIVVVCISVMPSYQSPRSRGSVFATAVQANPEMGTDFDRPPGRLSNIRSSSKHRNGDRASRAKSSGEQAPQRGCRRLHLKSTKACYTFCSDYEGWVKQRCLVLDTEPALKMA